MVPHLKLAGKMRRYTPEQFKTKLNKIYCCDSLKALKSLPDSCIDMVITSPPYWSLRDYGLAGKIWDGNDNCEHKWGNEKKKSINLQAGNPEFKRKWREQATNLESTQGKFCLKCNAWRGSLGLEPTYKLYIKHLCDIFDEIKRVLKKTGTCWVNIGDTYSGSGKGAWKNKDRPKESYVPDKKPKIVESFAPKSLYGVPERFAIEMQNRGWIRRNTIIWQKPNAMPSSAKDRFTVDFEYLYFFTKNSSYYFEQQFEPYSGPMNRWGGEKLKANGKSSWDKGTGQTTYRDRNMRPNKRGRNKRCIWSIPTKPLKKSNFAPYPEKLIETPIKAGCPRSGVVLDPFIGTGTTALVAKKLGRNFIGFELNPKYCKIAKERLKNESS